MSKEFEKVRPHLAVDSLEDIRAFFAALLEAGVNFHPEDTFLDVGRYEEPGRRWVRTFTDGEASLLDAAMQRAYEVTRDLGGPHDPSAIARELLDEWRKR